MMYVMMDELFRKTDLLMFWIYDLLMFWLHPFSSTSFNHHFSLCNTVCNFVENYNKDCLQLDCLKLKLETNKKILILKIWKIISKERYELTLIE